MGVALDAAGNVYVADHNNHCIRKSILSATSSAATPSPAHRSRPTDIVRGDEEPNVASVRLAE
jgi:hypothetical protein